MPMALPNDFVNDTTADAAPVQQNYQFIEQYVNANVVTRDGVVGMDAPLLLAGPPSQPLHASTKAYVDAVLPIGIMLPYSGVAVPAATWALCNGTTLATASYPDLFNVIGYRFGGSGANFILPNTAGRTLIGVDPADVDCDTVGDIGGTTTPPLLQHQHDNYHDHGYTSGATSGHTHSIAHDHGGFETLANGAHTHDGELRPDSYSGSDAGATYLGSGGSPNSYIVAEAGSHVHYVDVPSYSGTSGDHSTDHQHVVSAYTGDTGNTVQTADTKYRPPYVTISYIIRIL